MTEKISVIIVTRNREKMLLGCLDSLVKQTRQADEIIVINNASTDKTKEVILSFEKKLSIRYFLEKQIGIPYARNRGVREASGTLLLMLDDDCIADKFWVKAMVMAHRKYPKAWVIEGKTGSLPKERLYSLLAEFDRFCYLQIRARIKQSLSMKNFFGKDFSDEIELSTCDTKNFSLNPFYLRGHKLSFDENFYRGSDTDLGKQIMQKKGLIMFYPKAQVFHWERSSLKEFLKQRWYMGRTTARIADKWKIPSFSKDTNMMRAKRLFALSYFCKVLGQWRNLPILMMLLLLDMAYRLSGWFYEKKILSLAKQ